MRAQELAARLGNWRQVEARYLVLCPGHDDHHQSLELKDGDKGIVLICRVGCEQERVLDLVCAQADITPADLFYEPQSTQAQSRIVAIYDYCDAQGTLLYQAVRFVPKDFRQRRPDGKGGWLWNLDGVELVLYRLHEVFAAAQAGRTIYLPEGERDVETLRTLGLIATCNPMGAKKWRKSYSVYLRDAHVIILPDNDTPGRQHAQQVAQALYGIAFSVKVVELPGLPEKGDVSDWVQAGGTREQLELLVRATPVWTPSSTEDNAAPPAAPLRDTVWQRAISAEDFVQQHEDEHQSLTADLVYPGCITLIAAPRGTGKSIVALIMAVAEVTGGHFRDERLQPARVLYVDRDNFPQLIRNRLRHIGVTGAGQLRLITRIDAPPLTDRSAWLALPWQQYDVVIIDSIGAATEGVSEREGKETQRFLATLKDLAQKGLAIVALDNTVKAGTNYRGRGEKADAVDILYEARDITNWTPTQTDWWEELPEAGDHTWARRASRHRNKTHMRIAFVASKFRLGMDPEPFALEIDFQGDIWTLRDVTEELAQAGAETHDMDRKAKQDLFRLATEALVTTIGQRLHDSPLTKTEAERVLIEQGLRRNEARNLLEAHDGHHWRLEVWLSRRGRPTIVVPLGAEEKKPDGGENNHAQEHRSNQGNEQRRFPLMPSQANGVKHHQEGLYHFMPSARSIYAESPDSARQESVHGTTSNNAAIRDGGISAANTDTVGEGSAPQSNCLVVPVPTEDASSPRPTTQSTSSMSADASESHWRKSTPVSGNDSTVDSEACLFPLPTRHLPHAHSGEGDVVKEIPSHGDEEELMEWRG